MLCNQLAVEITGKLGREHSKIILMKQMSKPFKQEVRDLMIGKDIVSLITGILSKHSKPWYNCYFILECGVHSDKFMLLCP